MPTKGTVPIREPLEFAREKGLVRLREFVGAGFAKAKILRLCKQGVLERVGRGLYALPTREVSDNESLVQVAERVPHGVLCLLTALRFHDLGDQNPSQVWLAIDRKARRPNLDWPVLEVVWWSSSVLSFGVERCILDDTEIRITSAAKTVADCLKYRNKLGVDVAVQAVRDYRRKRLPIDELFAAAEVCRVQKVLKGYLEVMA